MVVLKIINIFTRSYVGNIKMVNKKIWRTKVLKMLLSQGTTMVRLLDPMTTLTSEPLTQIRRNEQTQTR
jgi:hypothetical protein